MGATAADKRLEILSLLSEGQLTVEEATELMNLLEDRGDKSKSLRVSVKQARFDLDDDDQPVAAGESEVFDFKIPLSLISMGAKLKGVLPYAAHVALDDTLKAFGSRVTLNDLENQPPEEIAKRLGRVEFMARRQKISIEYR